MGTIPHIGGKPHIHILTTILFVSGQQIIKFADEFSFEHFVLFQLVFGEIERDSTSKL